MHCPPNVSSRVLHVKNHRYSTVGDKLEKQFGIGYGMNRIEEETSVVKLEDVQSHKDYTDDPVMKLLSLETHITLHHSSIYNLVWNPAYII